MISYKEKNKSKNKEETSHLRVHPDTPLTVILPSLCFICSHSSQSTSVRKAQHITIYNSTLILPYALVEYLIQILPMLMNSLVSLGARTANRTIFCLVLLPASYQGQPSLPVTSVGGWDPEVPKGLFPKAVTVQRSNQPVLRRRETYCLLQPCALA